MKISTVEEYALSEVERRAIQSLLIQSFVDEPCYQDRLYFKQLPHRRVLAEVDGLIVGQCGIDHRVVSTSEGPASVFGIIDLCVAVDHRRGGVASQILETIECSAREHAIDYLILFASDQRLYHKAGFRRVGNPLRWMKVDEHASLGMAEERVEECMVKPTGVREWPGGVVDLLGYLF